MRLASAGINGFGRFGLHLLRYWALNHDKAQFSIDYVNDDQLSLEAVKNIVNSDPLFYSMGTFVFEDNSIKITLRDGSEHIVKYTNEPADKITWVGKPDIFLECSGQYSQNRQQLSNFFTGGTNLVLVSATSTICDQILIYGYNHETLDASSNLISYGSCTVNAFFPLASELNKAYGILESDVNIIHNVPSYKLEGYKEPVRKECTLEALAPSMLSFLNPSNFKVNYTLIPYTGVSIIDYRFKLGRSVSQDEVLSFVDKLCENGGLYELINEDSGAAAHKFTSSSAVLVKSSMKALGDNLYIHAYFDNENSVNRYFDVANYILEKRGNSNG